MICKVACIKVRGFCLFHRRHDNDSALWLVSGLCSLILFAVFLTRVDSDFAGRAYAAYGGIYIAASVLWLWVAEGRLPNRRDVAWAAICLVGAAVILGGAQSLTPLEQAVLEPLDRSARCLMLLGR